MNKPVMKRNIAVTKFDPSIQFIEFYSDVSDAHGFREFGELLVYGSGRYGLRVDARYDFDEVVKYIQEYGQEK